MVEVVFSECVVVMDAERRKKGGMKTGLSTYYSDLNELSRLD